MAIDQILYQHKSLDKNSKTLFSFLARIVDKHRSLTKMQELLPSSVTNDKDLMAFIWQFQKDWRSKNKLENENYWERSVKGYIVAKTA